MDEYWRVTNCVINLRNQRSRYADSYDQKDAHQESQLLYNESLKVLSEFDEWVFIRAVEQPFTSLQAYEGWIEKKDIIFSQRHMLNEKYVTSLWALVKADHDFYVSFGTSFEEIKTDGRFVTVRLPDGAVGKIACDDMKAGDLIEHSKLFLGFPYLWGGRSAYDRGNHRQVTGVDCSGFVNLLYRVQGLTLPRNAVDQWCACRPVEREELQKGDLIFSSTKGGEKTIDHVMLYCGEGVLIESTMSVRCVREISLDQKMKQFPCDQFFYGRPVQQFPGEF
jgi:gamma-D-glutamyl-L-lysine dipeptidyl-peptidase